MPDHSARLRSALATLCLAAPLAAAGEPELLDGIAAQVDEHVVLVSDVLEVTRGREQALRAAGASEADVARLRASALETLIEEKLMQRVIDNNEMGVEDEEVNRTIEQIAAENGLSVEQLYASVVFHGLSVEAYRAQIKGDIERRNLVHAALGQKVEVSDDEVRALYQSRYGGPDDGGEAVRVRQILRAIGGPAKRPAEVACAEARAARERVLAGEDFPAVAAEVSEVAPGDGGDIGWLPLASVAPWMSGALEGLEPGGVSEVLELPFGCSVLQLVERRAVEPVTFEQAGSGLRAEIFDRKLQEQYRTWMEDLREQSYIERRGYFADAGRIGGGAPANPGAATP